MSVSFSATAAIGLRVRRSDLYKEKVVPGCSHNPPKGATFCPTCGGKAFRTDKIPIDETLDDYPAILDGFLVDSATDSEYSVVCVLGIQVHDRRSECEGFARLDGLENKVVAFKKAMTARGLWDANQYGLHAVLSCG